MFTCIACSKAAVEDDKDDDGESGTPSTKGAVKSLTSQIKDMAMKFPGALKQCKPCPVATSIKKGERPNPDFNAASDGVPYPFIGGVLPGGSHRRGSRFPGAESTSAQSDEAMENEGNQKEWMAQVEPGVHITFVTLPRGANDLKRIRFSREIFNKWEAQRWWGENYERIMELYNVQRFNRQAFYNVQRSEDEPRDSAYSRVGSSMESPIEPAYTPRTHHRPLATKGSLSSDNHRGEMSSIDASRTTTSSRDDAPSVSNASEMENEWIEQDEPGVYITIRQLPDGTRELRRVRFSRERFGEVNAKIWWEQNRERIEAQYL